MRAVKSRSLEFSGFSTLPNLQTEFSGESGESESGDSAKVSESAESAESEK